MMRLSRWRAVSSVGRASSRYCQDFNAIDMAASSERIHLLRPFDSEELHFPRSTFLEPAHPPLQIVASMAILPLEKCVKAVPGLEIKKQPLIQTARVQEVILLVDPALEQETDRKAVNGHRVDIDAVTPGQSLEQSFEQAAINLGSGRDRGSPLRIVAARRLILARDSPPDLKRDRQPPEDDGANANDLARCVTEHGDSVLRPGRGLGRVLVESRRGEDPVQRIAEPEQRFPSCRMAGSPSTAAG